MSTISHHRLPGRSTAHRPDDQPDDLMRSGCALVIPRVGRDVEAWSLPRTREAGDARTPLAFGGQSWWKAGTLRRVAEPAFADQPGRSSAPRRRGAATARTPVR